MQHPRQRIKQKHTTILYYYSIFKNVCSVCIPGGFTFLEQVLDCQKGISDVSTPNSPFWVRYRLRQSPLKSSISPLFTPSKITTIPPKIPSNPYKSSTFSNSAENTIFNKEITYQKPSIYISSIIQNTSKINTFQPY